MPYPHVHAAFINSIAEDGTKAEAIEWLQRQWDENCRLRAAVDAIYYAAYWKEDRLCDAEGLWSELRDAAKLRRGQTADRLGPSRHV